MFIDNILIYSKDREEHADYLRFSLGIVWENKLYGKLSNCEFWFDEVQFLSHVISRQGISVDPVKVQIMLNWECPKTANEVRNFYGLIGYYRNFVERLSYNSQGSTFLMDILIWSMFWGDEEKVDECSGVGYSRTY